MRRFTVVLTTILALATMVASVTFGASAAAAQVGPGSRVLINGQVMSWSDFYELDQSTVSVVDGVELIDLYSATGWFRVVTTNFPAYGDVLRDLSVRDLQSSVPLRQIDRGDYSNVSYSLDTTVYQGVDIGAFTLVLDQGGYAQLTMVVAPVQTFQYELQIAKQELAIGGAGTFQGVDPVKMQGILTRATGVQLVDLNAPSNTTVIVVPNAQASAQQQPVQTGQGTVAQSTSSVVVGATEVGWTGAWQPNSTSATQASWTRAGQSGSIELVSYGEFVDASVTLAANAVDTFATAFLQGAGATGVQQMDGGVLQNGAQWKIYRFNLNGGTLATFVMAAQTSTGAWSITTVTATSSTLMLTMIDVQAQFSVNRSVSLLRGVDPVLTTISLLG